MTWNPFVIEALGAVGYTILGSSVAISLTSLLTRVIGDRLSAVSVRLPSGKEVRLDLDSRLSPETVSSLVAEVIRSAKSEDEKAIQRVVEASHAASQQVREANAE